MTDVLSERDLMVPMRDGVHLATDVYRPTGPGPWAVLLERTPYNKLGTNHADCSLAKPVPRAKPEIAAEFARAGYVYVLQDCRGRYRSEGAFNKYLNEGEDGVDTLGWLLAQPWCNGRIGTLGLSYGAHVQTALAGFNPDGLFAMWVDSGGFSSAYHSGIRQGGAFELKQLTWAMKHAQLSPLTAADPQRKAALAAQSIGQWARINPWLPGVSPLAAAPEYESYVLEQWRQECFDSYWQQPGLYARGSYAGFADVPMVHQSSWFDPYAQTAIENYQGLGAIKRGPVRLLLGPWTHGQRSLSYAGDVDFGPAATLDGNLAPDYIAMRLAWFDRYLRQSSAPDYLADPVTYFRMGGGSGRKNAAGRLDHGGRWQHAQDWPPPGAKPTAFYLHAEAQLRLDRPTQSTEFAFDFDPANPVPTIGGATASGAPLMQAGAFDQRESADLYGAEHPGRALADRADVLVFETDPLAQPIDVSGPVAARLWVSSSALDTDFTIKLVDFYPPNADYPQGFAMNLCHGILRLRFRNGFEGAEPLVPNQIYEIVINAFPTSNCFAAGHRIRLEISSSNFPHFDVNPNSGASAGSPSAKVIARNRVLLGSDRPSQLLLSVLA